MDFIEGLQTAFINKNIASNAKYKPEFITNDIQKGQKVLACLEQQLNDCEEFILSVAFITEGGLSPLLQTLKNLEEKNIKGKILTSDYLNFSQPKALRKLLSFSNIETRMYSCVETGFHTKGYIFKKDEVYTILVGSSNLTLNAITKNKEWNTKFISHTQGEITESIFNEFNHLWDSSVSLATVIDDYETIYNQKIKPIRITSTAVDFNQEIKPNSMQRVFLNNLNKMYETNQTRALLISATGTGKTYAAAFAVKDFNPKRALFLVHREQIAKQAMKSFQRVINKETGLLSGNSKNMDAPLLFSTMQMMAKEEIYTQFDPHDFDYIIIDEAHRVGSSSYLKIMEYFKPKFCLGVTASPERTDDFDVFAQFNNNIAYEIRLQKALEEELLCPFHYYGISDIEVEGKIIDKGTDFTNLVSEERVKHLIDKISYYGYSGDNVCGLIFCSNKEEASVLSNKFNENGFRTRTLFGSDSQEVREKSIEELTQNQLDYIFTVDIFNEGVDIPDVNQIVMLRPTQSPIIFVQQLGRGLRKFENKEYVIILDFIGNYDNNFMIPLALSGDKSYNKDTVRRFIAKGNHIIPGSSTIHFDEISKQRIYSSIDSANFNDIKYIKESYNNLKNRLGRIPNMIDFIDYGELDLQRVFDNKSLGSYYKLLLKYEKSYDVSLSKLEDMYVEFISKKLANGKRAHELILLKLMLTRQPDLFNTWKHILKEDLGVTVTEKTIINIFNIFTNEFPQGSAKNTYNDVIFLDKESINSFKVDSSFDSMLSNVAFKNILLEIVEYAMMKYKIKYSNTYEDKSLVLYEKYTYEDVCRLLEWRKSEVALNIGGYKFDKQTKTYPVFINYDKHEEISATMNYEDRFISNKELIAISKSGRTKDSDDVVTAFNAKELDVSIELFVRKNKDDKTSKEFYYLGPIETYGSPIEFIMEGTTKSAVEINYKLAVPVREDIYEYIVEV